MAVTVPVADLGVEHERIDTSGSEPPTVDVDARLLATTDSIDVTGSVAVAAVGHCRRCLTEQRGMVTATIDERYQVELTDPDAFPIEHGQLDLTSMARELMLLELDEEVLCRADCAGLCPVCGVDRNTTSCTCDTEVRDARWAALDALRVED